MYMGSSTCVGSGQMGGRWGTHMGLGLGTVGTGHMHGWGTHAYGWHMSVESGPRSGQWQGSLIVRLSELAQLSCMTRRLQGQSKYLRFRAWAAKSSLLTHFCSSFVQDTPKGVLGRGQQVTVGHLLVVSTARGLDSEAWRPSLHQSLTG